MTRTEWHHAFSLVKMYELNSNGQQIHAWDNAFENIDLHVI